MVIVPKQKKLLTKFQYRKRYEITCDFRLLGVLRQELEFQYRKRYEITCDKKSFMDSVASI